MRFLADENFPGDAVLALRAAGHDITWIRTDAPGMADRDVLNRAVQDRRVLLTFDKDFGELAWLLGLPADCGVVLFRFPPTFLANAGNAIADILSSREDWQNHFTVIEPTRIRMRPLHHRQQDGSPD